MGSGRHKWFSFNRSSSSALKPEAKQHPKEFVCPISGSLITDPIIVAFGQTLERSCPDFSMVIPNITYKSTILNWCDNFGIERPKSMEYASTKKLHNNKEEEDEKDAKLGTSKKELLEGVAEKPPVKYSHTEAEVNRWPTHFYTSTEESVAITIPSTPLPLSTRPSCYSSSSSSEITADDENLNPDSSEEDEKVTRTQEEIRATLYTPRLLLALRPLLVSQYSTIQINVVVALVNLSLEKVNKVKILRTRAVPPLIDEHTAGALFSLVLDDDNKPAIGVLGALPPLLHLLQSESERARHNSALALYHLSLVQSNHTKLVKMGSIPTPLRGRGRREIGGGGGEREREKEREREEREKEKEINVKEIEVEGIILNLNIWGIISSPAQPSLVTPLLVPLVYTIR
uniref:RING-type E3 ubiquitin transferase n=1 Tax=Nelumbo nucifera TaxID=4432 RepID=A0A822XNK2_NELNU|nr:TPA_asm: hypothetical protein HUJ06_022746 [Nelumbo nucifera]